MKFSIRQTGRGPEQNWWSIYVHEQFIVALLITHENFLANLGFHLYEYHPEYKPFEEQETM